MSEWDDVRRSLEELRDGNGVLCAVSGGLDSMCLLHLCVSAGLPVTAAHFNHQLRGAAADRDEAFVRTACEQAGISFVSGRGDVAAKAARDGMTVEEAARVLRYEFLEETRRTGGQDWILTAHHADDNAETLLLNLLRGTGLRGLTGIPEQREHLRRPLLRLERSELADYAEAHGIAFVEDETNEQDAAARNVLRHRVLPVLRQLNPQAVPNMNRTAQLLREDETALTAAAESFLAAHAGFAPGGGEFAPAELEKLSPAVRNRVIVSAMARIGGHRKDLTAAHVRAVAEIVSCRRGQVSLPYGMTAVCTAECLRIEKDAPALPEVTIYPGRRCVFGDWTVWLNETDGMPIRIPPDAAVTVSVWQSGDRLNGRTVKRLCADRGIAPTLRDRLPVLRIDGRAAAVAELGTDEEFTPGDSAAVRVLFVRNTEERKHEK